MQKDTGYQRKQFCLSNDLLQTPKPLTLALYYWTPDIAGVALYEMLSKCSASKSLSSSSHSSDKCVPLALGHWGMIASVGTMAKDLQLSLGQSPALHSTYRHNSESSTALLPGYIESKHQDTHSSKGRLYLQNKVMVMCGEGIAPFKCLCKFNMFKSQELVIQEKGESHLNCSEPRMKSWRMSWPVCLLLRL